MTIVTRLPPERELAPDRHAIELAPFHAAIERHSKSFALASRLLPRAHRDHAAIVYAWCRRADDAVDVQQPAQSRDAVNVLKRELDAIYAGQALSDPVAAAFQQVVRARGIPKHYPAELLAGLEMDAAGVHYESFQDLLLYCYRVAGTVGLMMCHVLGVSSDKALRHAAHLGMAMQLTNISRDVNEDWSLGRLYIPKQLLNGTRDLHPERHGRLPAVCRSTFARAIESLLCKAKGYYASGESGVRYLSLRNAWAIRAAGLIYAEIGNELARRGYDVLTGRAVVSKLRKLWLIAKASLQTLAEGLRRRRAPEHPIRTVVRFPNNVLPL